LSITDGRRCRAVPSGARRARPRRADIDIDIDIDIDNQ
jgi:hypothetical protein